MTLLAELTRVYTLKEGKEVKTGPITVRLSSIESVRPSNALTGSRSAIILTSGKEYFLAETYSEVRDMTATPTKAVTPPFIPI